MSNDYADRQKDLNAKAREDYKALLPALDPKVRALLEKTDRKTGKRYLHMDDSGKEGVERPDAAELPEPSIVTDLPASLDQLKDRLSEEFDLTPGQAEGIVEWYNKTVTEEVKRTLAVMLARILGTLLRVDNLKQEVYALLYATGTATCNGLGSMRKSALEILKPDGTSITVASLSKRACFWVGFLGLPPVEGMKSADAVDSYVGSARRGHATRRQSRLSRALSHLNKLAPSGTTQSPLHA